MGSLKNWGLLQGANLGALLITIAVNALSNILPLNGKTTGEISDAYPNLFTPAGYVFSIWGIIYALLSVFVVYQAVSGQRERPFLCKINGLFVLSSILNISWLFLWHYEQIVLSVVPMFALLTTLIAIYLRLQIGQSDVSLREKVSVHLPFSVYLGWITVATIANVAAALRASGWDGWGTSDVTWTILMLVIAVVITMVVVITRADIAFSLVIIWALGGVIAKQMENQDIVLTASGGLIIILIVLAAKMLVGRS